MRHLQKSDKIHILKFPPHMGSSPGGLKLDLPSLEAICSSLTYLINHHRAGKIVSANHFFHAILFAQRQNPPFLTVTTNCHPNDFDLIQKCPIHL